MCCFGCVRVPADAFETSRQICALAIRLRTATAGPILKRNWLSSKGSRSIVRRIATSLQRRTKRRNAKQNRLATSRTRISHSTTVTDMAATATAIAMTAPSAAMHTPDVARVVRILCSQLKLSQRLHQACSSLHSMTGLLAALTCRCFGRVAAQSSPSSLPFSVGTPEQACEPCAPQHTRARISTGDWVQYCKPGCMADCGVVTHVDHVDGDCEVLLDGHDVPHGTQLNLPPSTAFLFAFTC